MKTKCVSFLSGPPKATPKPIIAVLPDSYSLLSDKPAIDGVELTKDTTSNELNILSSKLGEYEPIKLSEADNKSIHLIAIDQNQKYSFSLEELKKYTKSIVVMENFDPDLAAGIIQKVKIK